MFGTVDVTFLVVVFVAGGERQASGVVSECTLQIPGGIVQDVQGVVALLPTQAEGILDGLQLIPPVTELDLEDVVTIF